MKRLAAAVLAIFGMAVGSSAAAQGAKFAVGQTWTGSFQGFGTWTVRFSELDDEGDPRGITSAGPDQRTAGGFDSNGRPAFYTVKGDDAILCYAASATAQNGVYNGLVTRQQGNAAAQKLGTPCTFVQGAGSQGTGSPVPAGSSQSGSAVWPPALSIGTTVRIETRSVWTGTLTGQDKTDWVGKVTNPNGGTGKMYGYQNDDGSFEFQVVNTSGTADQYEYCTFEKSSMVSPGVYTGDRYFAANKDAQPQRDGTCRVVIGASQSSQPPASTVGIASLLGAGVTLRLEGRQVWTLNITAKDSDGDWTGKATGADGKTATLYTYMQNNGLFAFQLSIQNSGGAAEYCELFGSGSSASGYAGTRYFAPNKDTKAQPDGNCRVTFAATSSQVSPQPQPSPPPQPQASGSALAWPSNITVGQTWRVVITGAQATTFTLSLTGLDEFETPSGKIGSQTVSMFPSRSQEATVIEIIGSPGTPIISCTFKGASSMRGSSLVGGKVQTRVNRGALPVEQPGTCEATLVSGGSAAAVSSVAPTAVPPAPAPQTGTPPVTSAWPLKLEVNQSWRAEIQGVGSWVVNFKILDRDGYPQGSAVPNGGSGQALEAAFFYFQNDNDMRLKLTSGNTLYRCIFERNEINGLTFSGWRYVDSADGKSLDKTEQRCTMQYIGRVTLSNLVDPLAGFASSVTAPHSSK